MKPSPFNTLSLLFVFAVSAVTPQAAEPQLDATSNASHQTVRPEPRTCRPNILLILADDLGYSDLGCYGGEIDTPNLDRLAAAGLRFARFYNAGRCCPTRASLLTGLYPHQAGIGHMTYDAGEPGYRGDLSRDAATIAETLKAAGYRTAMCGKWHLTPHTKPGDDRSNWPRQRGFDYFFGTLPGYGSLYAPAGLYKNNDPVEADAAFFFYTDALADHAIDFLNADTRHPTPDTSAKPFFIYLAFTAPHYPIHAREETIRKYDGVFDGGWDVLREQRFARLKKLGLLPAHAELPPRDEGSIPWEDEPNQRWQARRMQAYAAMVDEMDQAIGRVLAAIEEREQLADTLVVFLSDNGASPEGHLHNTIERMEKPWVSSLIPKITRAGAPVIPGDVPGLDLGPENTFGSYGLRWASLSNTPFRRHKAWMHEGGIATPCIFHWPAAIAPGRLSHEPGHIIDLLPTFLDLADASPLRQPFPLPGKTLRPLFNNNDLERNYLAWEHEGNRAIRQGDWKLVSEFPGTWSYFYPYPKKGAWELYNLDTDPTELHDLASHHPEKVAELEALYQRWADASLVIDWAKLENKKE